MLIRVKHLLGVFLASSLVVLLLLKVCVGKLKLGVFKFVY